jgi:hypothetical protein
MHPSLTEFTVRERQRKMHVEAHRELLIRPARSSRRRPLMARVRWWFTRTLKHPRLGQTSIGGNVDITAASACTD